MLVTWPRALVTAEVVPSGCNLPKVNNFQFQNSTRFATTRVMRNVAAGRLAFGGSNPTKSAKSKLDTAPITFASGNNEQQERGNAFNNFTYGFSDYVYPDFRKTLSFKK